MASPANAPSTSSSSLPRCCFLSRWTKATELGPLAKIFQQDSLNLPQVQKGLKTQEQQEVIFGSYNEAKIRHFYHHLFKWLEVDETSVHITR